MEAKILYAIMRDAGIGGIAIYIIYRLFREAVRKSISPIFPKLNQEQAYRIFLCSLILIGILGIAGIASQVYLKTPRAQILVYRGSVRDTVTKLPVSDAIVSMLGRPDIAAQTTDNAGNFSFALETAKGDFQGNVQVMHPEYDVWEKPRSLKSSLTEEVLLNKKKPVDFILSGDVRDEGGAVEGVRISVKDSTSYSTKEGTFRLAVKGQPGEKFELKADKNGYKHWQENGVEARNGISIILEKN